MENVLSPLIPAMTSNTAPYGEVSASSYYDNSHSPYYAFDGRSDYRWCQKVEGSINEWVSYEFNKEITARFITCRISIPDSSTSFTGAGKIQCKVLGGDWEDVSDIVSYTGTNSSYKQISFSPNKKNIKAVRFIITESQYLVSVFDFNVYG